MEWVRLHSVVMMILLACFFAPTSGQSIGGVTGGQASSAAGAGQDAAKKAAADQIYGPPNTYPQTTLKCYSTLQKPDGRSICPEARAKFCVKEISTLRQDICGHTQYFGDQYVNSVCVLKKCSAECVDEVISFKYADLPFTRQRTCCATDYCNSGSSIKGGVVALLCALGVSLLLLLRL